MGDDMKIQYDDRDFRGTVGSDVKRTMTIRGIEQAKRMRVNNILVWCGLFLVNFATFPSLYNVIVLGGVVPPATLTGGVMLGLFFYLAYSVRMKLWAYAVGETIGIMSNGTLLILALSI
jgi:hypothetical protein|tara:strand:- start:300 stop:656 length:357 start_codon:yes stop_codon:yes gene_type:complete